MKRIVVVSDTQIPFHNERAVRALVRFVQQTQPDEVLHVGDVLDAPQISRWYRGLPGEFTADLGKHRDLAVRALEDLGVTHLSRSNHDERIELYVEKHAAGLLGLDELRLERFLRLDEIGCTLHRKPYEFTPGWYLMHGDEGGLHQQSGATALNLARKVGASVVIGHTHRMGIVHDTDSISGHVLRAKTGFEVGCLMDLSKAEYLKKQAGSANWQLGFGVLDVSGGGQVQPYGVTMDADGSFLFEGRRWR